MKIAYISSNARIPSRDANSIHLMKMCGAYAKLGNEVSLYVSNNQSKLEEKKIDVYAHYGVENKFKIKRIPQPSSNWGRLLFAGIATPLLAKHSGVDFVHSRNLTAAFFAAKFMNLPVVYELHNAPDRNLHSLKMFRELINTKSFVGLVTITKGLSDYIKPFINKSTSLLVAPDGVDEKMLDMHLGTQFERKLLNLNTNNKRLAVYTGHLFPGRGIDLILEIASQLEDYIFYIIGGTEADVTKYKKIAKSLNNVVFVGFLSPAEVSHYQRAADVLLMPYADKVSIAGDENSNTAAFASPLKMFEYMATGRPIVSSTLPILNEVIENNQNAFMVSYTQPLEWIRTLKKLSQNPELGDAIGRQALMDVAQYTWTKRAESILAFINKNK